MNQRIRLLSLILITTIVRLVGAESADQRDTESPYGVLEFFDWNNDWNKFQYPSKKEIEHSTTLMKEAGIGMVRQTFAWNGIENVQGKFHFERHDLILDILERKGLRTLGVISFSAAWTGRAWNDPPDPKQFSEFVRTVIHRYKTRIKYWEIWNEPDQTTYWSKQDNMQSYVELVKQVYPVIKQEDPTAVVILGSVNTPFPLRRMYQGGVQPYFDVANIHPFVNPLLPHSLERVKKIYEGTRKIMAEFGDENKSIWITEIGCPEVQKIDQHKTWWEGRAPSEEQQAQWVTALYTEPLKWPGIGKVFWAFFRDTENFNDAVDHFGLIRHNFKRKPAYNSYKDSAFRK